MKTSAKHKICGSKFIMSHGRTCIPPKWKKYSTLRRKISISSFQLQESILHIARAHYQNKHYHSIQHNSQDRLQIHRHRQNQNTSLIRKSIEFYTQTAISSSSSPKSRSDVILQVLSIILFVSKPFPFKEENSHSNPNAPDPAGNFLL